MFIFTLYNLISLFLEAKPYLLYHVFQPLLDQVIESSHDNLKYYSLGNKFS